MAFIFKTGGVTYSNREGCTLPNCLDTAYNCTRSCTALKAEESIAQEIIQTTKKSWYEGGWEGL